MMTPRRTIGLLLVALPLFACGEGVSDVQEAVDDRQEVIIQPRPMSDTVWCAAKAADPQQGRMTIDDSYAIWATRVPGGFAGIWLSAGSLRFGLRDLSQSAAAIAALEQISGYRGTPVQVRYDWLELYGCYRVANAAAWRIEGVFSSDIQELNNRLEYGASSDAARQAVIEQLLAARIPRDLFEVSVGKPPVLTSTR